MIRINDIKAVLAIFFISLCGMSGAVCLGVDARRADVDVTTAVKKTFLERLTSSKRLVRVTYAAYAAFGISSLLALSTDTFLTEQHGRWFFVIACLCIPAWEMYYKILRTVSKGWNAPRELSSGRSPYLA